MYIYWINLFALLVWYLIAKFMKIKNKALFITIMVGFQLFLLAAFRDSIVGADTHRYIKRFYIIIEHKWTDILTLTDVVDFEIGYIIFSKFVGSIIPHDRFLLIAISAIIVYSVSMYIYKNSKIAILSFFIFVTFGFWGMSLNTLRQFMAIAILLPSIKYIVNKEFWKFFILVLIASSFHISAFSFIIMYPLSKIKITKIYLLLFVVIGIFTYLYAIDIIVFFIELFGYHQHYYRIGQGSGKGMLFLLTAILVAALYYRKLAIEKINNYDLYIHFLLISILLNILALDFNLAGRVMIYYTIHNIILMPNIIFSINSMFEKNLGTVIVLGGSLYFYWIRLKTDVGSVVPYEFMAL